MNVCIPDPVSREDHIHPETCTDENPYRNPQIGVEPDAHPPADGAIESYAGYQVTERCPRVTTRCRSTGFWGMVHLFEMLTGAQVCSDRTLACAISVPIQINRPTIRPLAIPQPCTTRGLDAASTKPSAMAVVA